MGHPVPDLPKINEVIRKTKASTRESTKERAKENGATEQSGKLMEMKQQEIGRGNRQGRRNRSNARR